jgi:hypothetical protein
VEVDGAAALELGHLGIGDPGQPPQPGLAHADLTGQGSVQGDGGPAPQLRRQGVPEHLRLAVMAPRAERLAQPGIVLVVTVPAARSEAVWAAGSLAVGMAGQHQPAFGLPGVDPPEAGGGEGDEQPWMPGHGLGDALAALEPGGEELVGISPVGGRTRRAAGLPPGAARLQQHPVRLPLTVVDGADLARPLVGVLDPAGQADGVVAVAGLGDQLGPPRIAGAGPVDQLSQDTGEQLPHPDRLRHATSPGAGTSGTTRRPGACSASSSIGSARSPVVARMTAATWWWSTCGVLTRWKPGRPGRLVTATRHRPGHSAGPGRRRGAGGSPPPARPPRRPGCGWRRRWRPGSCRGCGSGSRRRWRVG